LARRVIEGDATIDEMEIDVEEECLKVLALHQPVAGDLRFIVAVLKINNDLERIADLAVNIAERAINLASKPPVAIPFDLFGMAHSASSMLKNSLNAMINLDSELASQVCVLDDEVDAANREAFGRIQDEILQSPQLIDPLIQLLSVSRHIERIADLATNIAEDVIYMARGQIVRHRHEPNRARIRLA
jgi:phosphate transport system protein